MTAGETDKVRETVIALIESDFESDAAFERTAGLRPKTVNNWRRGLSKSFMKMIPELSELFHVSAGELLNMPVGQDSSELSDEEMRLVHLYRKTRSLPKESLRAVVSTIESVIEMYLSSAPKKPGRKK